MFKDVLKAFDGVHSINSAPMPVTLRDLAKWATTFNDWRNVFYRAEAGSIEEKMAFFQMATFAKTFGQWLNVYYEALALEDKAVESISLNQLFKLADDPIDVLDPKKKDALKLPRWKTIFNEVPKGSEAEATASERIIKLLREEKERSACPHDRTKI